MSTYGEVVVTGGGLAMKIPGSSDFEVSQSGDLVILDAMKKRLVAIAKGEWSSVRRESVKAERLS